MPDEPTEAKQVSVAFVRRYTLAEHTCPVCGAAFRAPRLRVYCGDVCKQRAAWGRHGAEFNERRKAMQGGAERGEATENEPKGENDEKAK